MHTLSELSRVYDIIIDGVPDEEQHIVANVVRALKSANTLYEQIFSVRRLDKFVKFVEDEGFEMNVNEFIIPLINNTKLIKMVEVNNSAYDLGDGLFVSSIVFPDGDKIYICNIEGDEETRSHDAQGAIATSPGFNLQTKLDMFWKFYENGIFVRSADSYQTANFQENSDNLVIEDLSSLESKFYGNSEKEIELFVEKIKKFRADKLQRSYLMLGLPGTGKSTRAIEISRRISNRMIKISSELFRGFDREDIDFIFKCLAPQFVIIDDFDRVFDEMASGDMLYFFEQLKISNLDVTVFCTINSIEKLSGAMIRPGRFDEVIVFNLPDLAERRQMIESFVADLELNIKPTSKQLAKLAALTDGFSPAYIKEYCLQLKYEPNFKELIRRINMMRQFVDKEDFLNGDLEQSDDVDW